MKKLIAILLTIIFMLALTACGSESSNVESAKEKETAAATTEAATEQITEAETEAVTPTEAETTANKAASGSDGFNLPFISDHTAAELIKYNVSELVALMGNDFDLERCGKRLVHYSDGGLCFYNDKTLPGYAFFLNEAEADLHSLQEAGKSDDEAFSEIKENILSGKYKDYDFFSIYGGAKYNNEITSNMGYVEISEITGSYELGPIIGPTAMRQPIELEPHATVWYESVEGKVSYERKETEQCGIYDFYNIEEAKTVNPKAIKIEVVKNTQQIH